MLGGSLRRRGSGCMSEPCRVFKNVQLSHLGLPSLCSHLIFISPTRNSTTFCGCGLIGPLSSPHSSSGPRDQHVYLAASSCSRLVLHSLHYVLLLNTSFVTICCLFVWKSLFQLDQPANRHVCQYRRPS